MIMAAAQQSIMQQTNEARTRQLDESAMQLALGGLPGSRSCQCNHSNHSGQANQDLAKLAAKLCVVMQAMRAEAVR